MNCTIWLWVGEIKNTMVKAIVFFYDISHHILYGTGGSCVLGVLCWSQEQDVRLERAQLLGLPVLQVNLASGGRWENRRLRRAARLLTRQGVRRVLVPQKFDGWQELSRGGLRGVDPVPLYRAMADHLILTELGRRGVENERACVVLRGEYVDADLERTARQLCPKVRTLIIQVEWGGERLARELYRTFGAALQPGGRPDAVARFSGQGQPGELVLCGQAELLGLELDMDGSTLPEGLEAMPLLTALWQSGRLSLEELRVNTINFP